MHTITRVCAQQTNLGRAEQPNEYALRFASFAVTNRGEQNHWLGPRTQAPTRFQDYALFASRHPSHRQPQTSSPPFPPTNLLILLLSPDTSPVTPLPTTKPKPQPNQNPNPPGTKNAMPIDWKAPGAEHRLLAAVVASLENQKASFPPLSQNLTSPLTLHNQLNLNRIAALFGEGRATMRWRTTSDPSKRRRSSSARTLTTG